MRTGQWRLERTKDLGRREEDEGGDRKEVVRYIEREALEKSATREVSLLWHDMHLTSRNTILPYSRTVSITAAIVSQALRWMDLRR